jgi:hypothetical protein
MLKHLIPFVAAALFAGCALLGEGPDTCDPGYVAAKQSALGLECNSKRRRHCPGVTEAAYNADPSTCRAVTDCYAEIDRVGAACVR